MTLVSPRVLVSQRNRTGRLFHHSFPQRRVHEYEITRKNSMSGIPHVLPSWSQFICECVMNRSDRLCDAQQLVSPPFKPREVRQAFGRSGSERFLHGASLFSTCRGARRGKNVLELFRDSRESSFSRDRFSCRRSRLRSS